MPNRVRYRQRPLDPDPTFFPFLPLLSYSAISISSSLFEHFLQSAVLVSSEPPLAFFAREFNLGPVIVHSRLIIIEQCIFTHCTSDTGGAIATDFSDVKVQRSNFRLNQARIGGAAYHKRSVAIVYVGNVFLSNLAEYDGAASLDCEKNQSTIDVQAANWTSNHARLWSGGLRIDALGGTLSNCVFESNSAAVTGGYFDFSWSPAQRNLTYCVFRNNSARERAGAFCAFHIQHRSKFDKVAFVGNRCEKLPNSISIESVDSMIWLEDVYFDGPQDKELGMRFGESDFFVSAVTKFEVPKAEMDLRINQLNRRLEQELRG
jgi:hypothetical protein